AEVAIERGETGATDLAVPLGDARFLENSGGRVLRLHRRIPERRASGVYEGVRASGEGRKLEIVRVAGEDVERPSSADFDLRSERPIAEDFAHKAAAAEFARLVDAAEDEAMPLIEGRRGTIGVRDIAILRDERGLQVGGIVDGMRTGVGREELVVLCEALAQIGAQPVIVGSAVGVVGIHVAERDAAGVWASRRRGITGRVETRQSFDESF